MGLMKNMSTASTLGRSPRLGSVSFDMFFDRQEMIGQMDKAVYRGLNQGGAKVRSVARASMRATKVGVGSTPGTPPHRHKHSGRGKKVRHDYGLQRSILYGFEQTTQSVVIGPSSAWGPGVHRLMATHEFGGTETKKNPRRRLRRVGGGGEVKVIGRGQSGRGPGGRFRSLKGKTTKKVTDTLLGTVHVTYARLRTARQARAANRINLALYGPTILHSTYPPRPTMGPALAQVAPLLPGMIRDQWAR